MKKLGRTMRDRQVKTCRVTREFAADSAAVRDMVEQHLRFHAGDVVLHENWRTGAIERWVLRRPLGEATTRSGEGWDDFLSNTLLVVRSPIDRGGVM